MRKNPLVDRQQCNLGEIVPKSRDGLELFLVMTRDPKGYRYRVDDTMFLRNRSIGTKFIISSLKSSLPQ